MKKDDILQSIDLWLKAFYFGGSKRIFDLNELQFFFCTFTETNCLVPSGNGLGSVTNIIPKKHRRRAHTLSHHTL